MSPSASTSTAALRKCSGPAPSTVPTIIGAPMSSARSPTTSAHGSSSNAPSVSMTSSGQTTRSTGGSTSAVASTWRSNTSMTPASVLRVPCSPPPCTRATEAVPTSWPRGASIPPATTTAEATSRPAAGRQARRTAAAAGLPDEHGDEEQQQAAPDPQHRREGPGHLSVGEVAEGHAAERPRPAQQLGQGPGAGQRQPAAAAGRRRGDARSQHGRVEPAGDHVAGRGERGHPDERRHEAPHRHEPAPAEAHRRGLAGDHPIEADEADPREWPEPDRRERRAQRRAAGDAGAGEAEPLGPGWHRGMMAARPISDATRRSWR